MTKSWLVLIIAGFFEVIWAIGLKYTDGFTKLTPSLLTLAALFCSMWLLSIAAVKLPIGTAYGVWVGIGALGTAFIGMIFLKEPFSFIRLFFLFLLMISILGLKLTSKP